MPSEHLRQILVCPACRGGLIDNVEKDTLDCPQCRLHFPVRDGVPVMLLEEAEPYELSGGRGQSRDRVTDSETT